MKKVKSLSDLENGINNRWDFYRTLAGKEYKMDIVFLLNMKLNDIIMLIREGNLHYVVEH